MRAPSAHRRAWGVWPGLYPSFQAVVLLLAAAAAWAAPAQALTWRWAHPHPQGNDLHAVAAAGGTAVAVGEAGTVVRSTDDGASWSVVRVGPETLRAVATDGAGIFVAVGTAVLRSTDGGASWTDAGPAGVALGAGLEDVIWAPGLGLFVAVGPDLVLTSPDGLAWTGAPVPAGGFGSLRAVAEGDGGGTPLLVAVTADGRAYTSADGLTWNGPYALGLPQGAGVEAVAWGGAGFLASATYGFGQGLVYRSAAGQVWTPVRDPTNPVPVRLLDLAWDGSQYLAAASAGYGRQLTVLASGDGAQWSVVSVQAGVDIPGMSRDLEGVAVDGATVHVAGAQGTLASGPVGGLQEASRVVSRNLLRAAAAGGGFLAAVGRNGELLVGRDDLGRWNPGRVHDSAGQVVSGFSADLEGVTWSGSLDAFVAVGSSGGMGVIVASADPDSTRGSGPNEHLQWYQRDLSGIQDAVGNPVPALRAVAANGAGVGAGLGFVAVGDGGFVLKGSGSSGSWSLPRTPPSAVGVTASLRAVVWAADIQRWVVVGDAGTVLTSVGADVWTPQSSGVMANLRGVAWSPDLGLLVAVGDGGTILTSPDGTVWTQEASPTQRDLHAVLWEPASGQFLVVGDRGVILASADGRAWAPESVPFGGPRSALWGVAAGGGWAAAVGSRAAVLAASLPVPAGSGTGGEDLFSLPLGKIGGGGTVGPWAALGLLAWLAGCRAGAGRPGSTLGEPRAQGASPPISIPISNCVVS